MKTSIAIFQQYLHTKKPIYNPDLYNIHLGVAQSNLGSGGTLNYQPLILLQCFILFPILGCIYVSQLHSLQLCCTAVFGSLTPVSLYPIIFLILGV